MHSWHEKVAVNFIFAGDAFFIFELQVQAPHHIHSTRNEARFYPAPKSLEMADASGPSSRQGQVQVYFTTNSADIELPEEKRQLLVPTSRQTSTKGSPFLLI